MFITAGLLSKEMRRSRKKSAKDVSMHLVEWAIAVHGMYESSQV
jgi:hypothetical protein